MSLQENIRMFQIGELYNLDSSSNSFTNFNALGVEPDIARFEDAMEPEFKTKIKNTKTIKVLNTKAEELIASKYSRAMRFTRGSGIIDNATNSGNYEKSYSKQIIQNGTSASYNVGATEVLTIRFWLKWQESSASSHSWLQKPIYCILKRDGILENALILQDSDGLPLFNITSNWYYVKIIVDNATRVFKTKIFNPIEKSETITYDSTPVEVSETITSKSFNLSQNSYIYLGIDPYKDFEEPAMMGMTPIIDDMVITIASIEDTTGPEEAVKNSRNILPLFYDWFNNQHYSKEVLRIY